MRKVGTRSIFDNDDDGYYSSLTTRKYIFVDLKINNKLYIGY